MGCRSLDVLRLALPWRTFRRYKSQKHWSGSLWTATGQDLLIHESRLELARLPYAVFDILARHIVAQPFLLSARSRPRRPAPWLGSIPGS